MISRFDTTSRYTSSVVLNGAYDYDPQSRDDELIRIAVKVLETAVAVIRPEVAIIVATFPIRK